MVIDYALGIRIIFVLGITNILFLVLVFFSCRCLGGARLLGRLFKHKRFLKFYSKHCWFWWGFYISVIIHTVVAFLIFPIPF
jgi:hypothetical protein